MLDTQYQIVLKNHTVGPASPNSNTPVDSVVSVYQRQFDCHFLLSRSSPSPEVDENIFKILSPSPKTNKYSFLTEKISQFFIFSSVQIRS